MTSCMCSASVLLCNQTQLHFVSLTVWLQAVSLDRSAELQAVSSPAVCKLWTHTVSSAAHSQLAISESSCTRSGPLQSVSPALICQLSCNLTFALEVVDLAICQFLAAAGPLSCSLSAWLPRSQSTLNCCSFSTQRHSHAQVCATRGFCAVSHTNS